MQGRTCAGSARESVCLMIGRKRTVALGADIGVTQLKQAEPAGAKRWWFLLTLAWLLSFVLMPQARADFVGDYALSNFTLTNTNADGTATTSDGGSSLTLTGGNNGSGNPGTTDFVTTADGTGLVTFDYSYSTLDFPGYDNAGYLLAGTFIQLADSDGQSGMTSFNVTQGESFGFRVGTIDNQGEPGILTVSDFAAPTPEPGTMPLVFLVSAVMLAARRRLSRINSSRERNT